MPTKTEIQQHLRAGRADLEAALARLTPEQMARPATCGGWSVKDLLGHILSWEQHLLADYARLFAGQPVREFANDAEIDAINAATFECWRDVPLEQVQDAFARSYQQVEAWLESASEAQLATPYLYQMTAGGFFRIDTWTHYEEHLHCLLALDGEARGAIDRMRECKDLQDGFSGEI